ncbi:hypothetical protein N0V82_010426 [Gnomoniopsis sp. IMI 355080]|nr:hypothetical protein N0V82_010426 [Gnomoniopsis sp. IMI 355080]
MAATRPKLPALKTPTTASFPVAFPGDALLSASSVRTPLSALSFKGPVPSAGLYASGLPSAGLPSAPLEYPPTPSMLSAKVDDKPEKTPITPPSAYMDFLKTINPASPAIASPPLTAPLPAKASLKRTATGASTASVETIKSEESTTEDDLDSAPTSASSISVASDCSCMKEHAPPKSSKPAPISTKDPASPVGPYPLSAPATGPTTFPSLRVPPSPAVDTLVRSPWSARSVKSPFDWDAALKARRYTEVGPGPTSAGPAPGHSSRCEKKGTSVRHIREVVTRTVTYTPRMEPAPRGKRRKLNDETAED